MYFTTRAMHLSHAQRGQGTSMPGVIQASEDQPSKKSVLALMLVLFLKKIKNLKKSSPIHFLIHFSDIMH